MRYILTVLAAITFFRAPVANAVNDDSQSMEAQRAMEVDGLVDDVLLEADLRSTSFSGDVALSSDEWRSDLSAFQDEPSPANGEDDPVDKADKTGTNPINFTFDFRVYNEYLWLNTAGDGSQNLTTLEFRAPFADGKWQFRVRARANVIKADLNDDGFDELDDSGFGDLDFRLLTVPYLNMEKRIAFAVGLEVFLDTASEEALGTGSTALGPQAFLVFFKPFGMDIDLFAPAYQHRFSVDGNDVNQSLIDLFILKTSEDKTLWAMVNPTIIIDHEANTEFALFDIELGAMLDKYLGTKGHSAYVRPSAGIGQDRPYDASIEVGYKIVF